MSIEPSEVNLQSGIFSEARRIFYECELPLVTSTCRQGNHLV
jgi:hypothetical protein